MTVTNLTDGASGRDEVGTSVTSNGFFSGFAPTNNTFGSSGQIGFGIASTGTQYFSNTAQSTSQTVRTNDAVSGFGFSTNAGAGGYGESRPATAAQPSTSGFTSHQPSIAAQSTPVTNSRSIFGQQTRFDAPSAAPAAVVGGSASSQIYSLVEQLSSEEKSQFESAKFTLGNIPVKPPPQLYV